MSWYRARTSGTENPSGAEEPAEADEITRLLYVATTRAADRLILSAGMSPDLKPEFPWMQLLAERFHLDTGLLKGDPYFGSLSGTKADPNRVPKILVHREPPIAVSQKEPKSQLVPLDRLTELLSNAEAEPFPETMQVYHPAADWQGMISVSSLEQHAGGQRPTWSLPLNDEMDDDDDRPRRGGRCRHGSPSDRPEIRLSPDRELA